MDNCIIQTLTQEKYELVLDETKEIYGYILYRIRALKDFGDVKKGDIGGYIEKEENLSHEGKCWVYDEACVYKNAKISGDAQIYGHTRISDDAWVFGYARISDNAQIFGDAQIYGYTRISDDAQIGGDAQIFGYAWVYGQAQIFNNAWISGYAKISGNARVYDSAKITGHACISHSDHWMLLSSVGSENGTLTAYRQKDNSIGVTRGSFSGTLEEFAEKVNQEYGDNKYGKVYRIAIQLIKHQLKDVNVE